MDEDARDERLFYNQQDYIKKRIVLAKIGKPRNGLICAMNSKRMTISIEFSESKSIRKDSINIGSSSADRILQLRKSWLSTDLIRLPR